MALGSRLKLKRKDKKLTQKELASLLGIDHTTVSKWESDTYEPDATSLAKLAEILDCSIDYLLGRTDDPSSSKNDLPDELKDPEANIFFKDYLSAPKEKQEELKRFWEYIKQAEKDRKPGDKQGDS